MHLLQRAWRLSCTGCPFRDQRFHVCKMIVFFYQGQNEENDQVDRHLEKLKEHFAEISQYNMYYEDNA